MEITELMWSEAYKNLCIARAWLADLDRQYMHGELTEDLYKKMMELE